MPDEPMTAAQRVAEANARRVERRKKAEAAETERLAIDLEAIDALEDLHGHERIKVLTVAYHAPDLPVRVAVRVPDEHEMARYRATVRDRGEPGTRGFKKGDALRGAEDLAGSTLVYPDEATFALMCALKPALKGQVGGAAALLATADEEEQGKD